MTHVPQKVDPLMNISFSSTEFESNNNAYNPSNVQSKSNFENIASKDNNDTKISSEDNMSTKINSDNGSNSNGKQRLSQQVDQTTYVFQNKEGDFHSKTFQEDGAMKRLLGVKSEKEFVIPVPKNVLHQRNQSEEGHFLQKDAIPSFLRGKEEEKEIVHQVFTKKIPEGNFDANASSISYTESNGAEAHQEHGWMNPSLFAQALLKGMGVEKTKKSFPDPYVPQARVKLAGLGSELSLEVNDKADETISQEKLLLHQEAKSNLDPKRYYKYDIVKVVHGPYIGLYASIEGESNKSGSVYVKLSLVSRLQIHIPIKEVEKVKLSILPVDHEARRFARSLRISSSEIQNSNKRQPLHIENISIATQVASGNPLANRSLALQEPHAMKRRKLTWLVPHIRVRMISKTFQQGKYYLKKAIVLDVPDPFSCTLQFENGSVYNDVVERDIETVIPKEIGSIVICVSGKHRGRKGKMIKKISSSQSILIEPIQDENEWFEEFADEPFECHFDHVCEYVG